MAATSLPDLPPAYSTINNTQLAIHPEDEENTASTTGQRKLELSSVGHTSALHVISGGSTLYYVGHYQAQNTADIIVYAGYDSNGPRLAQAKFIFNSKDFKIYVGDLKTPSTDDWDVVRCAEGGIFKASLYRFECRIKGPRGSLSLTKLRYHWKRTSESKLGASKTSFQDFKLVDEGNDEVIAVYVKQCISFHKVLDPKSEMHALLALLSLVEKSRRLRRQVALLGR